MVGTHRERFELAAGELDDMVCGNNGETLTQGFRPSYFTADWVDGHLVEVRIWGPRVLINGTTGTRLLDHRWRTTRARRPFDLSDLPSAVARRLRDYGAQNR